MTRQRIRRGVFHSIADLQTAINAYLAEHNDSPRHWLGSGRPRLGRPDETLAVDIGRASLDPDQLTTEFFETIVIESEAELDTALGNETPEDFFQDLLKVHASAPVAAAFALALGRSISRRA
jgi:hypothetical protein